MRQRRRFRQQHVDDGGAEWLNVSHEARTPLIEHKNNGLASLGQGLDKVALVLREREVGKIARRLSIGVLTHACHYDIGSVGAFTALSISGVFSFQ